MCIVSIKIGIKEDYGHNLVGDWSLICFIELSIASGPVERYALIG